ncbi:MAG: phospholipid carrier-dependent glycosyltransferase [Deltaproteobacteria bacterium]|nr:phospholipid carrier-dependent glycosyltransferase [Deltaproteobacteria bacterium]
MPEIKIQQKSADLVCISHKAVLLSFAIILGLGLLLRLPFISYPSQVVFDEVGFGKLFDIHPPHGKLLITAGAYLGGYTGSIDFSKIGTPCSESIAPLRFIPALAGAWIPVLVLILLRQLGASLAAAFLGALFLAFDNALVVQSRVIGLDTLLVLFILSSLSALLAARTRTGKSKIGFIVLSGMLTGLSVGTKFTGLAAAGLALVIMGDDLRKEKTAGVRWMGLIHAAVFSCAALAVYLLGWKLHFQLMIFPGEGDAFFRPTANFINDTFQLHRVMFSANAGITASHPYSSFWWQWPMMKKPIFYWLNRDAGIYFIGNPVVWWSTGLVFTWLMGYLIFARARNLKQSLLVDRNPVLWIPLAGYLISIIPLVPVQRPLFLYHYLPALIFSLIAGILWIDLLGFTRIASLRCQRISYYAAVGCCVGVFFLLTPVTYGLSPLSPYQTMLGWIGFGP